MKNAEFEFLKKDLEIKSNQIQDLKLQIEQHKSIVSSDIGSEKERENSSFSNTMLKNTGYNILDPSSPTANSNHLGSMVKDFHRQIDDLQRKLKITTELCTEQETKYQMSFQDMEGKLRKAIHVRDDVLQLRQSEANNQQKLINHLQRAMDSFDKDREECDKKIKELSQKLDHKDKDISHAKERHEFLEKNLHAILTIVGPDLRRLSLADFSDISVDNLPKCIEKLFLEIEKEKTNLVDKVNNKDRYTEEVKAECLQKLEEERELRMSMKSQHQIDIEKMQTEMHNFQSEVSRLNQCLKEKDVIVPTKLKQLLADSEEVMSTECKKLLNEKKDLALKCAALESTLSDLKKEKEKNCEDYAELATDMSKVTVQVDEAKEHIKMLEYKNSQLQIDVGDLQSTLQSLKHANEIERWRLESEIKQRTEECASFVIREKELKKRLVDLAENVTENVKEEEKKKHESELKEVDDVIENYKNVLKKAEQEIRAKDTLLAQLEDRLRDCDDTIRANQFELDSVNRKLKTMEKSIVEKDNTLVSALLQVDALTKENENTKKKCAELEVQIEKQNHCAEAQQEKLRKLEVDKIELIQNLEKTNFQSEFVRQEWESIKNGLIEKNNEIKFLQKERKNLAKKLKEKTENLLACDNEIIKMRNEDKSRQDIYVKVEKKYNRLNEKYVDLEKNFGNVVHEKNTLQAIVAEREESKDKEMTKILEQLKISKHDLQLLKEMLNNQKKTDTKALKIATTNQQVVTKQRTEIDHLKTKLQWLKEALEVSEATREEARKEMLEKEKVTEKFKKKSTMLQEENGYLKAVLLESQDESKRLRHALEKTAIKYADVHSLVEKQERFIFQEQQYIEHTKKNGELIRHQSQQTSQNLNVNNVLNETTADLRTLLKDVKLLLTSSLDERRAQKFPVDISNKTTERTISPSSAVDGKETLNVVTPSTTDGPSVILITPTSGKHSLLLEEYLNQHSTNTISRHSNILKLSMNSFGTNDTASLQSFVMASSPNENLASSVGLVYNDIPAETRQEGHSEVLNKDKNTDSNEALQRLKNKLGKLKDMGTVLTTNNKELTDMMKKQTKRLRNIKTSNS